MKLPRSKKKRIIKKWYKRTGSYKITKRDYFGISNGRHMYRIPSWFDARVWGWELGYR